jgi:hypothetical protein
MRSRLLSVVVSLFFITSLLALSAGCGDSATPSTTSDKVPESTLALADDVDVSRMMEVVEFLSSEELKGRPTGSNESSQVQDYLEGQLSELGLMPVEQLGLEGFRQEFEVPPDRCFLEEPPPSDQPVIAANVLGMIPGESTEDMVILTANYDGLGRDNETGSIYPGADYNASGVSAVMELATIFASLDEKPQETLVFAFLDAEECGSYGSQALAEALEAGGFRRNVRVINLEGLGAGEGDYMDIWDLNYSKNRETVEAVELAAEALEVELELGGQDPGTSAAAFFLYHLPAVTCDWSWFERSEHPDFHLPTDTPDRINEVGMMKVAQVVVVAAMLLAT